MSLGGTGSRDWLIQRFSAVFLAIYTLFLMIFLIAHRELSYETWIGLFSNLWMQIATLFALLCLVLHSWIGLWTILTDYVKPVFLRYVLQGIILFLLFSYGVWGVMILWE